MAIDVRDPRSRFAFASSPGFFKPMTRAGRNGGQRSTIHSAHGSGQQLTVTRPVKRKRFNVIFEPLNNGPHSTDAPDLHVGAESDGEVRRPRTRRLPTWPV